MASQGEHSPPPPPPSPPPLDAAETPPDAAEVALAKARSGGLAVRAAFDEVAAGLLGGMLPGERPTRVSTPHLQASLYLLYISQYLPYISAPHLQASLQRARAASLREVALPPAELGGAAVAVRLPPCA